MTIRTAEARDIPGMLELLLQVGQVHHQIRPDIFRSGCQKYDENALSDLLTHPDKPIFVAVEGEAVLGYCFCQLRSYDGTGVSTCRKELYIDDLCIDEASRGTGIAQALYAHAQAYARDQGCHFLTLNVWCGNERAMAFYEKMGLTKRNIMMETKLR